MNWTYCILMNLIFVKLFCLDVQCPPQRERERGRERERERERKRERDRGRNNLSRIGNLTSNR